MLPGELPESWFIVTGLAAPWKQLVGGGTPALRLARMGPDLTRRLEGVWRHYSPTSIRLGFGRTAPPWSASRCPAIRLTLKPAEKGDAQTGEL